MSKLNLSAGAREGAKRLGVLAIIALVIAGGYWFVNRPRIRQGSPGPLQSSCRTVPDFAKKVGVTSRLVFDTSQKGHSGLVVFDADKPAEVFQQPSWTSAGNLGPLVFDGAGNIYAAPVPNINTLENPPDKQNTIYQVHTSDAIMEPYFAIQHVPTPDQTNPYGILGLAYDCETAVIYASSISGSTATHTNGVIVAIDTKSKREISRIQGVDALSVGVYRDKRGAELYYGLANHSQVWRVGLAGDGSFVGKPSEVFSYDQFDELKPRKLDFTNNKTMQIHTTEFRYNLIASTEFRQENVTYTYDASSDQWRAAATDKP